MRKGGRVGKSSTSGQPEASVNTAASREQHSVPYGKLVADKSYIKVIKIFNFNAMCIDCFKMN